MGDDDHKQRARAEGYNLKIDPMRIVISGVGEVGSHLAKMLSGASHDITVIDDDPKRIEEVAGMADVITIEGLHHLCCIEESSSPQSRSVYCGPSRGVDQHYLGSVGQATWRP